MALAVRIWLVSTIEEYIIKQFFSCTWQLNCWEIFGAAELSMACLLFPSHPVQVLQVTLATEYTLLAAYFRRSEIMPTSSYCTVTPYSVTVAKVWSGVEVAEQLFLYQLPTSREVLLVQGSFLLLSSPGLHIHTVRVLLSELRLCLHRSTVGHGSSSRWR